MASSVKIVLLKHKKDKDGTCPIAIRITVNRKVRYIYTGHKVNQKDWSEKDGGQVKNSHPNFKMINTMIANKRADVTNELIKTELERPDFTSAQVKNSIKRGRQTNNFFDLAKLHLDELEQSKKISRMWSERPRIKHFQEFVISTTASSSITFQEINEGLLKKFISYLKGNREVSDRTVMNYMVVIRTLYNRAIQEGLADRRAYPVGKGKIRIQMPESVKIGLTEDEVRLIEGLKLSAGTGIWHARNVWLISFYFAGIRNGDVLKLKWRDLKDDRLYYTMGKNKKVVSVKVPDKAVLIFNQYRTNSENQDEYIFPELKSAIPNNPHSMYRKTLTASKKFNRYMEQVARLCGIEKKITTHIARHTFGNISGDKISPQMLQKLYRHSDIRTTMGYQANFIFKEADDALDAVVNF
jgi:integrase